MVKCLTLIPIGKKQNLPRTFGVHGNPVPGEHRLFGYVVTCNQLNSKSSYTTIAHTHTGKIYSSSASTLNALLKKKKGLSMNRLIDFPWYA